MAQRHLDRLSALDASFLHQEGPVAHMHIGALTILSAPPPTLAEVTAHIGSRLTLVPRFRQRLAHTPLDRGRPVWVDDRGFNLEYHVRHAALPAPGSRDQLRTLLARILSTQLDRRRPLWEAWFVEGLDDGGFALIFKTHHAVTDGVAGVELATVLFDARADAPAMPGPPAQWRPAPDPGLLGLLALGMARDARDGLALIAGAFAAVTHPPAAVRRLRAVADGLSEVVQAVLDPAPPTPLNVPIGPHRGFATASLPLANVRAVKDRFGGTVNDVVLTLVSGALRQFMNERGLRTDGLELRAMIPVSLRANGEHDALGNRLAAVRASLPVSIADPLERLAAVRASMDGAKQSRQVTAAEVLAGVQDYAPPAMLAQASRLIFSTRLFNLLVTNVPGPQLPLFVLGREIREAYPIAFLPRDHALAVAVASYNGMLNIGLLADHDALPEVDEIGAWMSAELDRLVALARSAEPGSL
jgi:diacylglycerol O-acyltransferase / wax synthase